MKKESNRENIRNSLAERGLKVTPQRIGILEAIYSLNNHPTAENIITEVRQNYPSIASGTVYKVLDTLVNNNLINKVTTDKGVMRYDGITENHHHLYCSDCDLIQDYFDEELDQLLREHFEKKNLPNFKIDEFVLQIKGKFKEY